LCNPQGRADSGCSHKWDSQCTLQSPAMQWSRPKLTMQAVVLQIESHRKGVGKLSIHPAEPELQSLSYACTAENIQYA
jgi:hypothetical protein